MIKKDIPSPEEVLLGFTRELERIGLRYMVGGSFASGIHGIPRMTYDADIVIEIDLEKLQEFVDTFKDVYYVDEVMIRKAVERRSSFNLIHLQSMFKIDVFVSRQGSFNASAFSRRKLEKISNSETDKVFVTSPEDIIIAKLDWFRKGNSISERQIKDVLGVVKVQNACGGLDWEYLKYWANEMGVGDLLEKVREDVKEK